MFTWSAVVYALRPLWICCFSLRTFDMTPKWSVCVVGTARRGASERVVVLLYAMFSHHQLSVKCSSGLFTFHSTIKRWNYISMFTITHRTHTAPCSFTSQAQLKRRKISYYYCHRHTIVNIIINARFEEFKMPFRHVAAAVLFNCHSLRSRSQIFAMWLPRRYSVVCRHFWHEWVRVSMAL